MRRGFRLLDEDHSGKVNLKEFEHGIQHFNLPMPVEHVMQLAKQCDVDGERTGPSAARVAPPACRTRTTPP